MGASNAQGIGTSKSPVSENLQTITSSKRGFLSQNFNSTDSNIFVIVVTALSVDGNAGCNFRAAMQWRETR